MTVAVVEIAAVPEALLRLETELRADPLLRGTRMTRVDQPMGAGEMGFLPEALQWITDNNELLAALIGAVAGWLARQRSPTRIRVRLGDREVSFESDKIKDPDAAACEMLERLGGKDK
jgi:hypothetical protein